MKQCYELDNEQVRKWGERPGDRQCHAADAVD
jgi:hypothetical protein